MPLIINQPESAIARGIKTVGVGKKGSQNLDSALALEILNELKSNSVSDAAKGAFLGGLLMKGISAEEKILAQAFPDGALDHPARLINLLTPDASAELKTICTKLLEKKELSKDEAYKLGRFLFSDAPGDVLRGMVASVLRHLAVARRRAWHIL